MSSPQAFRDPRPSRLTTGSSQTRPTAMSSSSFLLFRHMTLFQVWNETLDIFVSRLELFMILSAAVMIPTAGIGLLFSTLLGMEAALEEHVNYFTETTDQFHSSLHEFVYHHQIQAFWMALCRLLVKMVTTILGEAAMVWAVAELYAAGNNPNNHNLSGWWTCLRVAWRQLGPLIGASFVVYLPVYGGFFVTILMIVAAKGNLLLQLWGLVCFFSYSVFILFYIASTRLVFAIIMAERKEERPAAIVAVKRSFELSTNRRVYIMTAVFGLWFFKSVSARLLHNIFRPAFDSQGMMMSAIFTPAGLLISLIPEFLFLPLNAILKFVLYISITVDQEGLTQSILSHQQLPATVPTTTCSGTNLGSRMMTDAEYQQVSLLEDSPHDVMTQGLVSDFA